MINSTNDYSKFKNFSFNRKINKKKLNELIESIKIDNYLHLHPIIVDEDHNVIDGQHRLAAAKDLNLNVHYIQENNISKNHVINANINQSTWNLEDVINFYAIKERNESYIRLKDLMIKLKLKPKGVLGLIFGVCNTSIINLIKKGSFIFPTDSSYIDSLVLNYVKLIQFVEIRRITPRSMFSNANFTQAFRMLILNSTFDSDLFFAKLENKWFNLKPQLNSKEWFNVLIDIYNWHNNLNKIINV